MYWPKELLRSFNYLHTWVFFMFLSSADFSSFDPEAVVLLLLIRCWLLLPLCDSVIVPCFVVRYFVSILVLLSS